MVWSLPMACDVLRLQQVKAGVRSLSFEVYLAVGGIQPR